MLVRIWPRRTKTDEDLLDIWRHELRQLYRLAGYPGAQRYIARVLDAGSDAQGFYIVLDAGQRRPLQVTLDRGRSAVDWLRALNLPANRHRLWSNLQSVARGLEILHNEGLVHRNLDGWAILTSAGEDPDFQLTGFEWSLRLAGTQDAPSAGRGPSVPSVSFAADWLAFSQLAARVFNIAPARLNNLSIPDYEVHESASAAEVRLLRDLLLPNELVRLDGELVSSRIDALLETLDASRAVVGARYHLALRLSRESDLSRAVRTASDLAVEMDDIDGQMAWIEADLGPNIDLLAVGEGDDAQIFARGRELIYRLKRFRAPNDDLTWQFAFCESADDAANWRRQIAGQTVLPGTAVKLIRLTDAFTTYSNMRGRTPSWAKQIERLRTTAPSAPTRQARLHCAVTLLHGMDIAFAAANAFPVTVLTSTTDEGLVELTYRSRPDGDNLSEALGLDAPLQRLRDSLDLDAWGESEGWILTEAARLGQAQAQDVEVAYERSTAVGAEPRFLFRPLMPAPILFREGYLVPAGSRGDFVQLRRRSKAIRLMKDHTELLEVLADPRGRLTPTHDVVKEDAGYAELDEAKRAALKLLMAILPIFLLQGPPGVGKTFLIKDLVRRQFEDDRSSRLLVTAQGNHAIDHLLDELADLWKVAPAEAPLAVRCRPKDDSTEPGLFDLQAQTSKLADGLASSSLASIASPAVKSRLQSLRVTARSAENTRPAAERRALEGLVMRAANLVFATTNSADLERLLEERGQFDWAIVEEAGKATGCELVTPLMLSHRRLLIGDHKQLPPFGSQEMEVLLDKSASVRRTLKTLPKIIDSTVRNLLDEDLLEFIEDDGQDMDALCSEAKRVLYLFETLLTDELKRQTERPGGRAIASTLRVQHRMHPVICDLVSATFYGNLTTSEARAKQAASQENWISWSPSSELPNLPVVLIDMPYERSTVDAGRIERLPRFTNEDEVAEIVRTVAQLTVATNFNKKPSLVILTPYARQARRLKDAVLGNSAARKALEAFRPVARGGEWCSTVDSFQGNEADVVVFSLVRNNRGATLRRALGFVGDRRRFNVLLSRARQRFVFVGSWEFLKAISRPLGLEADPGSDFLRKFIEKFEALLGAKAVGRIQGRSLGGAGR